MLATWTAEIHLRDGSWSFSLASLDGLAVAVADAVDARQIQSITLKPAPRPLFPVNRDRRSTDAWQAY
jgi:hypothetical protein